MTTTPQATQAHENTAESDAPAYLHGREQFRAVRRLQHRSPLRSDLLTLFGIALAVRLVWAVLLPPWQGTDETEHFAYVNHLVEQGELPGHPIETLYQVYSKELQRSLDNTFFYPLVGENLFYHKPTNPLPASALFAPARAYAAPEVDRYDSGDARAAAYPPLYYALMAAPDALLHDAPIVSRLLGMRVLSGVLGAFSCVFAYLIAYEAFRSRAWGWTLGLAVAFMPTYAHLTASVNNDVAVDLGAMVLIWLSVRVVVRPTPALWPVVALIVVAGLTLLAKPSAATIIVVAAPVVIGRTVIAYGFWPIGSTARWRKVAIGATVACVSGISFAYFAVKANATSPVAFSQLPLTFVEYMGYLYRDYRASYTLGLFEDFWGRFGWGGAYLPLPVLYLILGWCLIGLVGAGLRFVRRPKERALLLLLLVIVVVQIALIFLVFDFYRGYVYSKASPGLQGRYFFPMLGALLLLCIAGWAALFHDHPRVFRATSLLMFTLNLLGWAAILYRYHDVVIG